ncbi:MAG TPA: hypothetical protein PK264_21435 [Hyphomicrobiaceae bacterium]|nr:hypothetical protein [Hyphomicrobiaceae bacterium]
MLADIVDRHLIIIAGALIVIVWAIAGIFHRMIKARTKRRMLDTVRDLAGRGMSADDISRIVGSRHEAPGETERHEALTELAEEMLESGWSPEAAAAAVRPLTDLAGEASRDPAKAARFAAVMPMIDRMLEERRDARDVQKMIEAFIAGSPGAATGTPPRSFLPPRNA